MLDPLLGRTVPLTLLWHLGAHPFFPFCMFMSCLCHVMLMLCLCYIKFSHAQ